MNHKLTKILLCLAFASSTTSALAHTVWDTTMAAATKACDQAHYSKAEKLFVVALKEAERFGPDDGRLPVTLNQLANLESVS